MSAPVSMDARFKQYTDQFSSLFVPGDHVLIRPVETWTADSKRQSLVDFTGIRYGVVYDSGDAEASGRTRALFEASDRRSATKHTNTFFGVCPRFGDKGEYDRAWQIRIVRALWSDIDGVTVAEAMEKIEAAILPRPSLIVSSGNGGHFYWILDTPFLIDDVGDPPAIKHEWIEIHGKRKRVEYFIDADGGERVELNDLRTGKSIKRNEPSMSAKGMLIQDTMQGIASKIGGDHTSDLARLLRVAGTLNRKDERNGKPPKPCELVERNDNRYPIEAFSEFAKLSPARKQREKIASVPLPSKKRMTGKRSDTLEKLIWNCANAEAGSRSETDFGLCAWCVEHGLSAAEIWPRVSNAGKFAERGEPYFERTWAKVELQARTKIAVAVERAENKSKPADDQAPQSDSTYAGAQHDGDRVEIQVTTNEFKINNEAIDALYADDSLFQRGGCLVTVVYGADPTEPKLKRPEDAPRISPLVVASLRETISKHVQFFIEKEVGDELLYIPQHVPDWCTKAVHARGSWPRIRGLRGIINHPVLKPDGSILTVPGYDKQTGLIFFWPGDPLAIPEHPTKAEAEAAMSELVELVSDFPFESDAHRSGWIAYLLTPLIRRSFEHPITAPIFVFDASTAGSGKTLLAELGSIIVCGFDLPRLVPPKEDEELRKHMLAIAMAGDELILLDNVSGNLGGQTLDAVLTGTTIKGRLLGYSKDATVTIETTFAATTNNAAIVGDLNRRMILSRIVPNVEKPEDREGFKIIDIRSYAREHRPRLLQAALTVVRAYVVAGMPDQGIPAMGSFEEWSRYTRSPIVWLGQPDPLEARKGFSSRADSTVQTLSEILMYLPKMDPDDRGITAQQIIHNIEQNVAWYRELHSAICDLCLIPAGRLPTSRQLGIRLNKIRDRIMNGRRLVGRPNRDGSTVWRVEFVGEVRGLLALAGTPQSASQAQEEKGEGVETSVHEEWSPETPQQSANPAQDISTRDRPRHMRPDAPSKPPWLERESSREQRA